MLVELEKQGVTFHVEEGQVVANYEGEMPDELRQRILEHREQIRAAVLQREQQVKGFLSRVFLELRKKPVVYANGEAGLVAFCRAGCRGQVKEGCVYVLDEQELRSLSAADYTSWKFLTMSKAVFGGTLRDKHCPGPQARPEGGFVCGRLCFQKHERTLNCTDCSTVCVVPAHDWSSGRVGPFASIITRC